MSTTADSVTRLLALLGLGLAACSGTIASSPVDAGLARDAAPRDTDAGQSTDVGVADVGVADDAVSARSDSGTGADAAAGFDAAMTTPCSSLAGSWSSGDAFYRADGAWDVHACQLASPGQYEVVKPVGRDPTRFAQARCNDGTPFGFFVRLAPQPSPGWLIYLQGGEMCDDYAKPCSARDGWLTTTPPFADRAITTRPWSGLFSTDPAVNPDFHAQNQVLAHYCSSDIWAGATTELRPSSGDPANGWYFSGHANVDAMLATLVERYGLDDTSDSLQVLFSGGSAGAFGAHLNASRVLSALPAAAAAGRVKLLVDAGWFIMFDDPDHRIGVATTSDLDVFSRARSFWGATFDPDCEAALGDSGSCFFPRNWYPYVAARQPILIQQSSFDAAFTASHQLAATEAAAQAWRNQVEASFTSANVGWLFSGADSYHTLGLADTGMQKGPAGQTLAEVLGRFWAGGAAEQVRF